MKTDKDADYVMNQLYKLGSAIDAPFAIKITSDAGSSNYMNITFKQLLAIRDILTNSGETK